MYFLWHIEFAFADIDECSDLTLNECPNDTDCQNIQGNYTCSCKSGFQKNDSKCEGMQLVNHSYFYNVFAFFKRNWTALTRVI